MLDRTSLVITILGAINWLLVGLFQFDLVAYICGGQAAVVSRVIYTIVGIAGLWCISLLFRERRSAREGESRHALPGPGPGGAFFRPTPALRELFAARKRPKSDGETKFSFPRAARVYKRRAMC